MHDSYIEHNSFYDYDVIINFLNIYKKKQEFSLTFDEQKIEISISLLLIQHKERLN